jgi:hypothetical protein
MLQPTNRLNYPNAPVNAPNQIPIQQQQQQGNNIISNSNDVTIINPTNIQQHQKPLIPSQQQIPQTSNKRKYPDTNYPNQQANNPNILQQPQTQQNFQTTPQTRVIPQQSNF